MPQTERKKQLAEAIRRLRAESSQQEFAHDLNLAVVSVSRYEHGATPDLSVLRKFYERAMHQKDWVSAITFRDEIYKRAGLDANSLFIGSMTIAGMITPTEEGLVIGLIRLLRISKDKNELRKLHALLDRWTMRIDEIAGHGSLLRAPKSAETERRAPSADERLVVTALLQFLRDDKTSDREKRILDALLLDHSKGNVS